MKLGVTVPERYSFGRVSDERVLELGKGLREIYDTPGRLRAWAAGAPLFDFPAESEGLPDYPDPLLFGANSFFISRLRWDGPGCHIEYRRSQRWALVPQGGEAWLPSASPFVDSIEIEPGSAETAADLIPVIGGVIQMAPPVPSDPTSGDLTAQSTAILNRLSGVIANLIEHTAERQKDLDATRSSIDMEARATLAAHRKDLDEELEAVREAFKEKEDLLSKREIDLDDRANTHVRRELSEKMASLSNALLSTSLLNRSTITFYVPIALALAMAAILVTLIFFELNAISKLGQHVVAIASDRTMAGDEKATVLAGTNSQILFAQVRSALQAVGLAALGWWMLRFASTRYRTVNSWERDLHRFRLDTERAGFLVEGDLEARKVNGEGLPAVMLQSFSRGLFTSADSGSHETAAEGMGATLNALLGQAAKVRIGPDGAEVEVNGRGLRRAQKEIDQ